MNYETKGANKIEGNECRKKWMIGVNETMSAGD